MPFPCSVPSSADIAGLPVATPSLQSTGAGASNADAKPDDTTSNSFDHVLSGLDDSSTSSPAKDETSKTSKATGDDSATSDQLAMIASFLVPPAAILPPPPPATPPAPSGDASLTLVGAEGRSVPELLARGVETLEYNVAAKNSSLTTPLAAGSEKTTVPGILPDNSAVESAATVASPVAFAQTPSALNTGVAGATAKPSLAPTAVSDAAKSSAAENVTKAVTEPSAAANSTATPVPLSTPDTTPTDAVGLGNLQANAAANNAPKNVAAPKGLPKARGAEALEKTAGSSPSAARSGGYSSNGRGKNVSLTVDGKELKKGVENVGTAAANWGKTMYQDLRTFADAAMHSDSTGIGAAVGSGVVTTKESAPLTAALPSHAGELVHEIREIADGLWAVERNSVEVKFNFGQQDKLSVRVEYKDGTVSTTFRTDSPDLRDAIAREWQSQSVRADQRPYRMEDPVFSAAPSPSNFSMGGDASRQQRSSEQPAPAERFFIGSAPRSGGSTTTSPVVSPTSRPDTTGRLHAIA